MKGLWSKWPHLASMTVPAAPITSHGSTDAMGGPSQSSKPSMPRKPCLSGWACRGRDGRTGMATDGEAHSVCEVGWMGALAIFLNRGGTVFANI